MTPIKKQGRAHIECTMGAPALQTPKSKTAAMI